MQWLLSRLWTLLVSFALVSVFTHSHRAESVQLSSELCHNTSARPWRLKRERAWAIMYFRMWYDVHTE